MVDRFSQYQRGAGNGVNAMQERFDAFQDQAMKAAYDAAAYNTGLQKWGPEVKLTPLVLTQSTTIRDDGNGNPVSLNANTPSQILRFYFQDAAFIRKVTFSVQGLVLNPAGLSGANGVPPAPFEPQVLTTQPFEGLNPADYIFVRFERDGAGQKYQEDLTPLSQVAGTGKDAYLFDLIPVVKSAGSILVEVSIMPPEHGGFIDPPFVSSLGQVTISLHTDRFNAFGV